jgi:glycosyltransferase involved in cell wall biosynthesis
MFPRILVISDYREYHTTRGEAEIFKQLALQSYPVHILTFKEGKHIDSFLEAGVEITDFHPVKKFDSKEISFIKKVVLDWKADIVFLFNGRSILNGIQACKKLDVKIVLYRGDASNLQWFDPSLHLKFYHRSVDKILCNSIGVEETFRRQLFLDKSKLVTINKGHRVEWYEEYPAIDIRKELGLASDVFLAVCVANNRPMKGMPVLLKAYADIPANEKIHLLLIGNDMDDKTNLSLIRKHKMEDRVTILGFKEDALNIVAACDVKILASIKGESINKSVIEAMAMEIPPIISDIPGNRELVIHEKNGLVFPSKDVAALKNSILRLYNDRELCKQLGQEAKKHVHDKLHIDHTIAEVKKMVDGLMSA